MPSHRRSATPKPPAPVSPASPPTATACTHLHFALAQVVDGSEVGFDIFPALMKWAASPSTVHTIRFGAGKPIPDPPGTAAPPAVPAPGATPGVAPTTELEHVPFDSSLEGWSGDSEFAAYTSAGSGCHGAGFDPSAEPAEEYQTVALSRMPLRDVSAAEVARLQRAIGNRSTAAVLRSPPRGSPGMTTAALLRRLPGDEGLEIQISSGIEHWRGGEITLTIDGSGAMDVRHRRSGAETHYSGELSSAELSDLAERLAELGFATQLSERNAYAADEMTVTMVIRQGGDVAAEVHMPEGDRHDNAKLASILGQYEGLVERVTGGALPYEGERLVRWRGIRQAAITGGDATAQAAAEAEITAIRSSMLIPRDASDANDW